jgi:hypothetical protein
MKNLFVFFVVANLCSIQTIKSQSFVIDYDANGNRFSRHIPLKSTAALTPDSIKQFEVFQEDVGQQKLSIYPNPTRGELKIEITGIDVLKPSSIIIYNETGKMLYQKRQITGSDIINMSDYPNGLYILKVNLDNHSSEWKILKE